MTDRAAFLAVYFSTHGAGSEMARNPGNRAEVPRATVALPVVMQRVQHSAICQVERDGIEASAPPMNHLEVSALDPREHGSMTAAKSTITMPLSASSSITPFRGVKRRDSTEYSHEDEEQCQQQDNGNEDGTQRRVNEFSGELTVNVDDFQPVGKPFALSRFHDRDEDVANVRSPLMCKPLTLNARSASLSPTCVSALARDEGVKSDTVYDEPSWTIQEFQEYLTMLELLQDVSSDAGGGEMCLSADCLGQMERLLTSLLPQGSVIVP